MGCRDLVCRFHRDLLDKVTSQQQAQFQVDGLLFSFLQRSNAVRTTNPENASLFLVPALPTLYLALLQSQGPLPLPLDGRAQNHSHALALSRLLANLHSTSKFVEKALQHVQVSTPTTDTPHAPHIPHNPQVPHTLHSTLRLHCLGPLCAGQAHYPYWRRTNGRDHFILASHPYGRCGVIPYVSAKALGELFTVQPCGYAELHLETLLQPGSPLLPEVPSNAGAGALTNLASSLKVGQRNSGFGGPHRVLLPAARGNTPHSPSSQLSFFIWPMVTSASALLCA